MRNRPLVSLAATAAMAIALPATAAAQRAGPAVAQARPNINAQRPPMNRPQGGAGQMNRPQMNRPQGGQGQLNRPQMNRPQGGQGQLNRPQGNRQPGLGSGQNRPGRQGNNVVTGNTVVVGGRPGHGYYDNGRYYNRPYWEDEKDHDFLKFVGKTAAVTAGVAAVTAVIGSVTKDKPEGCQPVMSGGQQYQLCNGVYYQPVSNGYQVVAPPEN